MKPVNAFEANSHEKELIAEADASVAQAQAALQAALVARDAVLKTIVRSRGLKDNWKCTGGHFVRDKEADQRQADQQKEQSRRAEAEAAVNRSAVEKLKK